MGGGSKSSPTPAPKKPIETPNNDGVPDDAERRGLPIRERSTASNSLLAPGEEKNKQGMLY